MSTKLHRIINRVVINESSLGKDIPNVLLLGEVDTIRCGRDLKIKEVTKGAQIKHQELIAEALLHKIITRDKHVIDV